MASTPFPLTKTPKAGPDYTAASDIDVMLVNPYERASALIRFARTTNDTQPALDPRLWTPIKPLERVPFTLLLGERLWFIGPDGLFAMLES
ncbi:hypothetical protein [uncultured Roseobacter sp.]|uniref:hypothetical protein n=1 Tax=uncultured Roseobacter sp. TaxID=114847 RepID=UPI0026265FB7|nr:hypothetical protein [uncultured Roseobacter sp.]